MVHIIDIIPGKEQFSLSLVDEERERVTAQQHIKETKIKTFKQKIKIRHEMQKVGSREEQKL